MTSCNFVFIMTDTQGANILGAYGHPNMATPNIDNLAQNGIKFDRAYTTTPLCSPARAAIFSGLYANFAGPWANELPFGANIKTMGQRFSDNGYHTAYIGKWHLDGHDYFGTGLCPPGWDEAYWYDIKQYIDELGDENTFLWRTGLKSIEQLKIHNIEPAFTMAHRVSNRAIEFLQNRGDVPFLLAVSYDEPHAPFVCPPEYAEKFEHYDYPVGPGAFDPLTNKPVHHQWWAEIYSDKVNKHLTKDGHWRDPLYFGTNSFVDHEIGRVIQAVQRYAPENTYIIFTSDHGAMIGAHRLHDKGLAMYEQITHIPLIVVQPHGAGAGTINDSLVSHVDLLPTMLELAGLPVPPIMAGQSLTPLLNGSKDKERNVMIEFNRFGMQMGFMGGFQPVRCMISDHYKLVINLFYTDELYDLQEDPAELNNLIDNPAYTKIRNRLHDLLLDKMHNTFDMFRSPCWEQRPWRHSKRYSWAGEIRTRPDDGYAPITRDGMTGLPFGSTRTIL